MSMEFANERLPGPVRQGGIPVETFNPLLRSLLTWGLVERREDADGNTSWELIEEVRHRLDALVPPSRTAAASLAYLDHWCARCRQQRLTHLRGERFLCESCEKAEAGEVSGPQPEPKRPPHAHDRGLRRRRQG